MKKMTIEQQELLQQLIQDNELREITPFKALEMIKKQVGNIHVFTDEMPPQQTSIELRNSGLFEIIEKELKALEIIKDKLVDMCLLENSCSRDEYNKWISQNDLGNCYLEQEQYDLLKEIIL